MRKAFKTALIGLIVCVVVTLATPSNAATAPPQPGEKNHPLAIKAAAVDEGYVGQWTKAEYEAQKKSRKPLTAAEARKAPPGVDLNPSPINLRAG